MIEKPKNYKESNKIQNNWEDISKLIALENELLERIDYLENKLNRLWNLTNKL